MAEKNGVYERNERNGEERRNTQTETVDWADFVKQWQRGDVVTEICKKNEENRAVKRIFYQCFFY